MGLFQTIGSGLSGLFGEGFADRAAMAGALINGDYGAAAQIKAMQAKRKQDEADAAIEHEGAMKAYAYFKSQGMDDNAAITLAADPKVRAQFVADKLKPQQFGAAGGSVHDPITGKDFMAPSRHEFQGTVFDVGGGPAGQQAPVTPQHEGVQWITPQPGTTAFGVNSFSGLPMGAPQAPEAQAPPPQAPVRNDLRSQAIDAIRRGADPAQVLKRMQQLMQGGQMGSVPSGGFP